MIGIEKLRTRLPYLISMVFVFLFVYAAVTKLLDFPQFKLQLEQSTVLSGYSNLIAWMVPVSELVISFLLCFKAYRLQALYASLGLMVLFTVYIIVVLNFSDDVPCSCGGVIPDLGWNGHFLFNIGLIALALVGILFFKKYKMNTP